MSSGLTFSAHSDTVSLRLLRHRLIAVWALAEGVLGGILHGLRLPVTGLVVGSIAVCCLVLLAKTSRQRGDLLKATIVVLLIKGMLSPHSPINAYVAVLSQGLLAELLFRSGLQFKPACYLLGLLSQLQSAIQHLLKLILVFGLDIWAAFDQYLTKIAQSIGLAEMAFSFYFALAYLALHAITGIFIGKLAAGLPDKLRKLSLEKPAIIIPDEMAFSLNPGPKKKKFRFHLGLVSIWLLLLGIFLQSYFGLGPVVLPGGKVFQILIRSVLIVSVWYFVLSPLLLYLMQKWLAGKKNTFKTELNTVLHLLPETGAVLKASWKQSAERTGLKRLKQFLNLAAAYLFIFPDTTTERFITEK